MIPILWRYELGKRKMKVQMGLAWLCPRWLVYWCSIRLMAHATQGTWSSQNVPELTAMDALQRWGSP